MAGLTLVPFTAAQFATLTAWFDDEAALVQWGGPDVRHPLDDAQLRAMLAEGEASPPRRRCFTALLDGAPAGHIQVGFDWHHGVARIGRVAIAPTHRGRGLAAELLGLALERAWADARIERVELGVYTFNAPAISTYERVGFRGEGVRRSSVRVGSERWDTLSMSMLRDEWEAARDGS